MGSLQDWRDNLWVHSLIVCSVAVLILTASRGVGALNAGTRILDVFIHSIILVAVSYPFQTVFAATAMSLYQDRMRQALCAIGGCVLAAVPASALSPTLSWIVGVMPTGGEVINTRAEFFADVASRFHFIFFVFATLGPLLWMLFNFRWWSDRLARAQSPQVLADATPARPADAAADLINKLPPEKRGRLIAISAEQHYVRLITEAGEDLVLMPFAEAIARVPSDMGMRIHRSHWINRDAVRDVTIVGNGLVVHLQNGVELPVSRSFSGAVRDSLSQLLDA